MKETATLRAYLVHSYLKPPELAGMGHNRLADELTYSPHDMTDTEGWIEVGSAEVSVTLKPHDQIVADTVTTLRKQVQTIRAEAEQKALRIEGEIQKMLAISFGAA